jgi:hypothetical protein
LEHPEGYRRTRRKFRPIVPASGEHGHILARFHEHGCVYDSGDIRQLIDLLRSQDGSRVVVGHFPPFQDWLSILFAPRHECTTLLNSGAKMGSFDLCQHEVAVFVLANLEYRPTTAEHRARRGNAGEDVRSTIADGCRSAWQDDDVAGFGWEEILNRWSQVRSLPDALGPLCDPDAQGALSSVSNGISGMRFLTGKRRRITRP